MSNRCCVLRISYYGQIVCMKWHGSPRRYKMWLPTKAWYISCLTVASTLACKCTTPAKAMVWGQMFTYPATGLKDNKKRHAILDFIIQAFDGWYGTFSQVFSLTKGFSLGTDVYISCHRILAFAWTHINLLPVECVFKLTTWCERFQSRPTRSWFLGRDIQYEVRVYPSTIATLFYRLVTIHPVAPLTDRTWKTWLLVQAWQGVRT